MNHVRSLLTALASPALLLLLGPKTARAQDPAVVNAETIHVKLENSRVRVLEATLPPGTKEKPHSHPAYVIHIAAGGKMLNHAADGSTNEVEFKTGDTIYRDPIPVHWAENIGNTTIRLVLVELKDKAP